MFYQSHFADFISLRFVTEILKEVAGNSQCSAPGELSGNEEKHPVKGSRHTDNMQASIDRMFVPANVVDYELFGVHH